MLENEDLKKAFWKGFLVAIASIVFVNWFLIQLILNYIKYDIQTHRSQEESNVSEK